MSCVFCRTATGRTPARKSAPSGKGPRASAGTPERGWHRSQRHYLLIRRPPGQRRARLLLLLRAKGQPVYVSRHMSATGCRWPVEEDLKFGPPETGWPGEAAARLSQPGTISAPGSPARRDCPGQLANGCSRTSSLVSSPGLFGTSVHRNGLGHRLTSAIYTKVKSSLIMRLSCGNTLKSI